MNRVFSILAIVFSFACGLTVGFAPTETHWAKVMFISMILVLCFCVAYDVGKKADLWEG